MTSGRCLIAVADDSLHLHFVHQYLPKIQRYAAVQAAVWHEGGRQASFRPDVKRATATIFAVLRRLPRGLDGSPGCAEVLIAYLPGTPGCGNSARPGDPVQMRPAILRTVCRAA